MKLGGLRRELATALALAGVLLILAIFAPAFFNAGNLRDMMLKNVRRWWPRWG